MKCPVCDFADVYQDGALWVCPVCGYEWNADAVVVSDEDVAEVVKDANGTVLKDGDSVTLIKDLKLGGGVIKQGTLAKNITLTSEAGHNIYCKIKEFGEVYLKSEFVKKASVILVACGLMAGCAELGSTSGNSSNVTLKACISTEALSAVTNGSAFTNGVTATAKAVSSACLKKLALQNAGVDQESMDLATTALNALMSKK